MKITDIIPDPQDMLDLSPEELAGVVIEFLNALPEKEKRSISRHNFSLPGTVAEYPGHIQPYCQQALMEAWAVLEREGILVHKAEDNHGWYVISRRGSALKTQDDFSSFRHSNLFPKESVHPKLANSVYPPFLRGDYETAVFQAFKLVEVSVKHAAPELDQKLYGVDLMRKAFHPETGPLTDKSEPIAEREALLSLFAGAIGRFKNPSSHRHIPMEDPAETIEILLFSSHLLRVVEDRSTRTGEPSDQG